MKESNNSPKLIYEEKKAIKLFLWLFYIFYFSFDIIWYLFLPHFSSFGDKDFLKDGLGYWIFILVGCLLPISIYIIQKGNLYRVKFIFLSCYIVIDIIDNLIRYFGTSLQFASGNIVDLLFIFFSPIFVNKRYFWTVSFGIIGKYIFMGLILQNPEVIPPIVVLTILAAVAFIVLNRFNSYISSLTTVHEDLRQKEKLAVIGQMAAAIGHEIRNPLSSLKGFTQLQQERNPNGNDFYPIMIQEIDRINSIVNDLMYLGKPREIKFQNASIEEIISYTLSITNQQAERQGVTVETEIAGPLPPIECDEKQLKQVFINLIKNAVESMPNGGRIHIKANILKEREILISIEDEGCGIADDLIANLKVPFFTTKKDGTGLGLMVSNQIIEDHKGYMEIASQPDKGTIVNVTLPIIQEIFRNK
ncbi:MULTISPECIES: ATP-binding protein [Bacillaceae]|uniref:ATP-binding protein n=1 Tax=Bacillaceae TaxID=186817 RepID=UPI00118C3A44|nr:ATP-binding protein [Bacillus sp. S3]QCJ41443.1 two-component sensor histidine kinase [Bacillus sp. S3]